MSIRVQSLSLAKQGNSEAEYEDRVAADAELRRFAIADGATETSYAALWAQLLVDEFIRQPVYHASQVTKWLAPLQKRWNAEVGTQPLPWYAEAKLQEGACATFLGLVINQNGSWKDRWWRALAIGDCNLFQVREQKLHRVFPIMRSAEFGTRPFLASSRRRPTALITTRAIRTRTGLWEPGDQIWLMTDALAKWFLHQHELGSKPCETVSNILEFLSRDEFAQWIEGLRKTQELRNDDVTLLAMQL